MKLFFKSMWYGVKASYQENRRFILFMASMYIPVGVVGTITEILGISYGIQLILAIIAIITSVCLLVNYLHYADALEYSKKHDVSFEYAWICTKPSDDNLY